MSVGIHEEPTIVRLDAADALEHFHRQGWTDGLPVVMPTPDRVAAVLDESGRSPDEVVGTLPALGIEVTARSVAICLVMAGGLPRHFPITAAGAAAMLDPRFNLNAVLASTGGAAVVVLVSGPLAAESGMNARGNAFGPGNRANATIGRALRLLCTAGLGSRAGVTDLSSFGHPGRFTFCFAEDPPPTPWSSVAVDLGYGAGDTTVSLLPGEAPRQVANHLTEEPERILATIASALSSPSHFPVGKGFQAFVVLGPEHAAAIVGAGWSRADVRTFLYERSRVTLAQITEAGVVIETDGQHDMTPGADGRLPSLASPEDALVTTAGGPGPGWSAVIPCWGTKHQRAHIVTRRVRPPGEALPDCGPDGCPVPHDHFARR